MLTRGYWSNSSAEDTFSASTCDGLRFLPLLLGLARPADFPSCAKGHWPVARSKNLHGALFWC